MRISAKEFYSSKEWVELRYDVLSKSKGRCCLCGRCANDGVNLHVDHIKPRNEFSELALDPDNLQVLCSECNWGKGNRDCINWKEVNYINEEDIEDFYGRAEDTPHPGVGKSKSRLPRHIPPDSIAIYLNNLR